MISYEAFVLIISFNSQFNYSIERFTLKSRHRAELFSAIQKIALNVYGLPTKAGSSGTANGWQIKLQHEDGFEKNRLKV
jgi:hypothetical protein